MPVCQVVLNGTGCDGKVGGVWSETDGVVWKETSGVPVDDEGWELVLNILAWVVLLVGVILISTLHNSNKLSPKLRLIFKATEPTSQSATCYSSCIAYSASPLFIHRQLI